ncbi:UDP-N-acetylmuramoyl-L-alanyl-D-glutamate--2,6-diaminopimelate ligase [Granulicatella seriolae]|uniref:UDP-N-acetylmuramyl-tripeptide synthetase n=1 Tax=Granulicatella seriolae TaxID=2967226 RepID=A0ABT1WNH3_9LACT|nr:UDP-N-acetylmuramoyl-L-alanyl-D-glutamate--2,6-diaminopimelate ligase [Granulicatella seriolae]
MIFKDLIKDEAIMQIIGPETLLDSNIDDLIYVAKEAKVNTVYFALPGRTVDGLDFIEDAYKLGCRIFIVEKAVHLAEDALVLVVKDSRQALSSLSATFFGNPSRNMKVIGITGTKGKTTTSQLLYQVLQKIGIAVGVIGTNGSRFFDQVISTDNTTPESYQIQKIMAQMVEHKVKVCFMEVSSQGLMMGRVNHIHFDLAVFTNMANDHVGDLEHASFEEYLHWKQHLFTMTDHSLINADDAFAANFMGLSKHYQTYGFNSGADFLASHLDYVKGANYLGSNFLFEKRGSVAIEVSIVSPGRFSVYNALVVLAVADYLKQDLSQVVEILSFISVEGRMQIIPSKNDVLVILDYAHNGFSLENVILTIQHYDYKRLIVVFGSVGGRSHLRRKELGDVVAKYADLAIITSDNPDFEKPSKIIEDIQQSFAHSTCKVYTEEKREMAIQLAASLAQDGDIVIFAGKGHENYQLINGVKEAFDEEELIRVAFNQ